MDISKAIQQSIIDRLGSDTRFPISGSFQPISGTDLLLQDIQMLLLTLPGERPMRPDYGCNLRNQIWENIQVAKNNGIADIKNALDLYEPRIQVITVTGDLNENTGLISFNIQFFVLSTNSTLNLVFPFRVGSQLSFS